MVSTILHKGFFAKDTHLYLILFFRVANRCHAGRNTNGPQQDSAEYIKNCSFLNYYLVRLLNYNRHGTLSRKKFRKKQPLPDAYAGRG